MEKCDAVEQITLHSLPVVHVHELARNEPASDTTIGHPGMGKTQEMAVKSGETANLHAARSIVKKLKTGLLAIVQMMMPDVRWIADDEIETGRWVLVGKVSKLQY